MRKQFQFRIFIPENFGPPKIGIKIGVKLSSRNSNLFQFLFHFFKLDPKTKIETRLLPSAYSLLFLKAKLFFPFKKSKPS